MWLLPLLPLIRTPRLPVVDWTDSPANLNWLVRFAGRPNLVSARVPSHFKRSLLRNGYAILKWEMRVALCSKNVATRPLGKIQTRYYDIWTDLTVNRILGSEIYRAASRRVLWQALVSAARNSRFPKKIKFTSWLINDRFIVILPSRYGAHHHHKVYGQQCLTYYEGNSISKLQIQVATYVFELSAGNCDC